MQLNELLGIEAGAKQRASAEMQDVRHKLQHEGLISGLEKTYQPKDEDGDMLPPESKHIQVKVEDGIKRVRDKLENLFNITFAKEYANTTAHADVVLKDGTVLVTAAPATYLLFLEKQLGELRGFVTSLPVLDTKDRWNFDEAVDCYVTPPTTVTKTKKVPKALVLYEATDKHPAQVETYYEDVIIGTWTAVKYSSALPAVKVREMMERVEELQDAVRQARSRANTQTCELPKTIGDRVLGYVFGT